MVEGGNGPSTPGPHLTFVQPANKTPKTDRLDLAKFLEGFAVYVKRSKMKKKVKARRGKSGQMSGRKPGTRSGERSRIALEPRKAARMHEKSTSGRMEVMLDGDIGYMTHASHVRVVNTLFRALKTVVVKKKRRCRCRPVERPWNYTQKE